MDDMEGIDLLARDSDLTGIAEHLIDCQKILDRYGLMLVSAHLDMALAMLRHHVHVPEPSLGQLMADLGFGEISSEDGDDNRQ